MKISIITINYNHKSGLQKTIDSVISQTCKDFEWIIIDGGSTDGSKELIEQYTDYITYWVSEPDRGIYNAMNKGILASHGDYLLFLNSGDCFFAPDVLTKTVPLLKGKDIYAGNELQEGRVINPDFSTMENLFFTVTRCIPHQSMFFCRKLFTVYGLYREDITLISDWYFNNEVIILNNATIEKLPFIISSFEGGGVSWLNSKLVREEKEAFIKEHPRVYFLLRFYMDNKEIIDALKGNKFFFWVFRVYFYIYRKFLKRK